MSDLTSNERLRELLAFAIEDWEAHHGANHRQEHWTRMAKAALASLPDETTPARTCGYCPNCDCDYCGSVQARIQRAAEEPT